MPLRVVFWEKPHGWRRIFYDFVDSQYYAIEQISILHNDLMEKEFRRLLHGHLFPRYDSFRVAAADLGIAPSTLEAMCAGRRHPARIDLDWIAFKLNLVGDDKKLFVLTGLIAKAPAEIREIFFDHFERILRDYSCPEFLVFDYRRIPEEKGRVHYKSWKTRGDVELPDGRVISSKEGREMF